jgi:hypothetical protein
MVVVCVVSAVMLSACSGTDGGCGASSEPLGLGEQRTVDIEFTDGGWDVVDVAGVIWSADLAPPQGAPDEGTLAATVEVIDGTDDESGALLEGRLSVDFGELGASVLSGPVSCE